MPSRGVRDRSPQGLLARQDDTGVLAVRRGGRTRKARQARGSARRPKAPADGSDDVADIHEWSKLSRSQDVKIPGLTQRSEPEVQGQAMTTAAPKHLEQLLVNK